MRDFEYDDDDNGNAFGLAVILAIQGIAWLLIGLVSGYLLWGPV